jgi:DNA-binding response OmpR family regulator
LISGQDRKIPFQKGVVMPAAAVRILVVGNSTASTESTLQALARSGWVSHSVKTVGEARAVLRTIRFHLTLAAEKLPDGTGYELATLIAQQSGNLFISIRLSETCLWLAAVEKGMRPLGQRALDPLTLATEAEMILRGCDTAIMCPESERNGGAISLGQVDRAEAMALEAVAQLSETERFERQAPERYEHREGAAPKRPVGARRKLLRAASVAVEHPLPLEHDGSEREALAQDKRWRGF